MGANPPPTRTLLLEARRSLAFAREGYDLLDRKRQALIAYAMDMLARARDEEESLAEQFAAAYAALGRARMSMGIECVEWAALSTARDGRVDINERSIMGVLVPIVNARPPEFRLVYSLSGTTASLDRAREDFAAVYALVCRAAELRTAVWRLAREIRRTQRRVNALKNILIPRYEATVTRVEAALEEKEREDFYRAKALKTLAGEREGRAQPL